MTDKILVGFIGAGGAILGALVGAFAVIIGHWLKERSEEKKDKPREDLLIQLMNDAKFPWRDLDTLKNVIGGDDETTKRLLIKIGARGSENGEPSWALISREPLPNRK